MQAHEIMIKQVYKVKETDTIRAVIEQFIQYRISGLPVVNDKEEIIAYISDGDIMRFIGKKKDVIIDYIYSVNVFHGNDEEYEERVKRILDFSVMELAKKKKKVIKVAWNESIENVAAILGNRQIKKLPVERDGVLVGIISRGDVIRHSFEALL